MLRPITRLEQYLAKIAGVAATAPAPLTRLEQFLAKIAGLTSTVPAPLTRIEQYLALIAENGGGEYDGAMYRKLTPESDGSGFSVPNLSNLHSAVFIVNYPFWETGKRRYLLVGYVVIDPSTDGVYQYSRLATLSASGSLDYYSPTSTGQTWTYVNETLTISGGTTWAVKAGATIDFYYR